MLINIRSFLINSNNFIRKIFPHSVKSKIIVYFLIPVLLIYLTGTVIELIFQISRLNENTELQIRTVSSVAAAFISPHISAASASAVCVAGIYSDMPDNKFNYEIISTASIGRTLERILIDSDPAVVSASISLEPGVAGFPYCRFIKKKDGEIVCIDYSDKEDGFKEIYGSVWYNAVKNDYKNIYDLHKGRWFSPCKDDNNQLLIRCAAPIVRYGKFAGIISLKISLHDLRSGLRKCIPVEDVVLIMPDSAECSFMIDTEENYMITGLVSVNTLKKQSNDTAANIPYNTVGGLKQGRFLTGKCRNLTTGKDVSAVFTAVSPDIQGWDLMFINPASLAGILIMAGIQRYVLTAILILLIIIFIGIAASMFISRPIKKLMHFAEELQEGKIETESGEQDELGKLSGIFREMTETVNKQKKKLELSILVFTRTLSSLSEYRDTETGNHIKRTAFYAELLTREASKNKLFVEEKYQRYSEEQMAAMVMQAAPLHDIGKVAIPDTILFKAGELTREEREVMKQHVNYGIKTLREAVREIGEMSFLDVALEMCAGHHERYDGKGYPEGLSGQEIPLAGRIMAITDVYDALTTKRPYKNASTHEDAVSIIKESSGKQFDPKLVECFLTVSDKFKEIAQRYKDEEQKFQSEMKVF